MMRQTAEEVFRADGYNPSDPSVFVPGADTGNRWRHSSQGIGPQLGGSTMAAGEQLISRSAAKSGFDPPESHDRHSRTIVELWQPRIGLCALRVARKQEPRKPLIFRSY